MSGDDNTWYGLTASGRQVQIHHSELMKWAHRHDKQFQVGWSTSFEDPQGRRLVRGKSMISAARGRGWDDLAEKLEAVGFVDADPINAD